jgi:hypothetical protein
MRRWESSSERVVLFSSERDAHYPNFEAIYYLEPAIIVSVGGFHKPPLTKLCGIGERDN